MTKETKPITSVEEIKSVIENYLDGHGDLYESMRDMLGSCSDANYATINAAAYTIIDVLNDTVKSKRDDEGIKKEVQYAIEDEQKRLEDENNNQSVSQQ